MTLRLALLGSTGSIGTSALEVVRHHPERLSVATLAAFGSHPDALLRQVEEFRPRLLAVRDERAAQGLAGRLPDGTELAVGEEGLLAAATHPEVDRVIAALVGAAGLPPTHAALAAGKDVALANKESLVVAGGLLTRLAAARGATLLPIDSEHVALHQALRCGAAGEVRRLVLTASGGPFRTRPRETWGEITPAAALKHPTWSMGAKISIDSATLMNKGLELIEASHLFGVPPERIDVVVHPQSIVHSFVEYQDGSWIAQLSRNDMVFPIQYALSFPDRWENRFERLRVEEMGSLVFEPLDAGKFPSVGLARQALATSDSAPAVLNAANEVAVHAFLAHRIGFLDIFAVVETVLAAHQPGSIATLADALAYDRWGREQAEAALAARVR